VIRLQKNRDLIHKGIKKNCFLLASALPCPHETAIIKYEQGKEQKAAIFYNAVAVRLPGRDHPLLLVVVRGFGRQPMMLLTKAEESIWRIVEIYLTRWKWSQKRFSNLERLRKLSKKTRIKKAEYRRSAALEQAYGREVKR